MDPSRYFYANADDTAYRIAWNGTAAQWEMIVAEQTQAQRDYWAQVRERQRLRQEEQNKINEKAKALFFSCLSLQQAKEYGKNSKFKVTGSADGKYIVDCTTTVYNVIKIKNRKKWAQFCAYPEGVGSHWDIWLAQKLLLETDEPAFLEVANMNYLQHA